MTHPVTNSTPTLVEVQAMFAIWRKTRGHRTRIPEELWSAALKLSGRHSTYKISRALRLNYKDLKKRIGKSVSNTNGRQVTDPIDFIPIDIAPNSPSECIVEMEHRNGNRMRMHFKGKADLDLRSFAEVFWSDRQ